MSAALSAALATLGVAAAAVRDGAHEANRLAAWAVATASGWLLDHYPWRRGEHCVARGHQAGVQHVASTAGIEPPSVPGLPLVVPASASRRWVFR